jgi:cytochrome b
MKHNPFDDLVIAIIWGILVFCVITVWVGAFGDIIRKAGGV